MRAACGRYANMNMKAVMPRPRVSVGTSFEASGFQRGRWDRK